MKVLWLTNTPCAAAEIICKNQLGGGWLVSLERELVKETDIQLSICFYTERNIEPFSFGMTNYFPIYRKWENSKFGRLINRIIGKTNCDKTELPKLLSVIFKVQPDIIHVHGTEDNFGLIQYYTKIPVVISIQGILNPCVEKFYSGIPTNIARKYNGIRSRILVKSAKHSYNSYIRKASREREILKLSKNIIGRTEWDRRVTRVLSPRSHYYTGQEMLRTNFYQNEWGKTKFNDKIRILTITSDSHYKGFETIVKTANILSSFPNFDFEWLVIGLSAKSEIVILVRNWLKVDFAKNNILLLGSKKEDEIAKLLLSADIYCQVSHIENSPNSLCEAMILGIPSIASFAGGTNSILENGKEGILVQDGDSYIFAGAILECSKNFNTAIEYGRAARIRALTRHNKEKIISELTCTYQTIIDYDL